MLDFSCRKRDGQSYTVTDRWQKFAEVPVNLATLGQLAGECAEFLIHAVDVEGKAQGVEEELLELLGAFTAIPVTYAGGVGSFADLEKVKTLGQGHVDVTVGSALDLFGGQMAYREVLEFLREA